MKKYTRWLSYSDYLIEKYGYPCYRIGVDGGFSCPNREKDKSGGCTFCDGTGSVATYQRLSEQGFFRNSAYTEKVATTVLSRLDSIENQIKKGKEFIKRRYESDHYSLYFQSYTNTYDSVENLKAIYDRALSQGPFVEFIVSTRPDCLSDEVLKLLKSYQKEDREVWIEMGLQSARDESLLRMRRGHDSKTFQDAAKRIKDYGLSFSTHVILGLPGENKEDFAHTASFLNECHSDGVKIHNLHISGGTRMAEEYEEGEIVTSSFERHLENTEFFLRRINRNMVVQRLICETPFHRLMAPRLFPDKSLFLKRLEENMTEHNTREGDLV